MRKNVHPKKVFYTYTVHISVCICIPRCVRKKVPCLDSIIESFLFIGLNSKHPAVFGRYLLAENISSKPLRQPQCVSAVVLQVQYPETSHSFSTRASNDWTYRFQQ